MDTIIGWSINVSKSTDAKFKDARIRPTQEIEDEYIVASYANEYWWEILSVFGIAFLILGFYGFARLIRRRKEGFRVPGPLYALIYGVLLTFASFAGGAFGFTKRLVHHPVLPLGSFVLRQAGFTMVALLLFRLCAYRHFGGDALDLDFGQQWSKAKGVHPNTSMKCNKDTLAHVFQGSLSWLFYPTAEIIVIKYFGTWGGIIGRILCVLCVVYPIYNVKKRIKKHGEYFALSSFFNNQLEWAIGFLYGVFFGIALTVWWSDLGFKENPSSVLELDLQTMKYFPYLQRLLWRTLDYFRLLAGIILFIVTLLAAFQLWKSWDSRPPELDGRQRRGRGGRDEEDKDEEDGNEGDEEHEEVEEDEDEEDEDEDEASLKT